MDAKGGITEGGRYRFNTIESSASGNIYFVKEHSGYNKTRELKERVKLYQSVRLLSLTIIIF